MSRILIVYGTTDGHTARIAEHMRAALEADGADVEVERATRTGPEIGEVDGVIVGASVHAERHQKEIREFAKRNRDRLERMPSAFFQVCLQAVDQSPESKAKTAALIDKLTAETGWRPARTATFAGKLAWTQYGLFTRLLMKFILRKEDLSPEERDTSRDTDYTDYEAVARFAKEFARTLGEVSAQEQPSSTAARRSR